MNKTLMYVLIAIGIILVIGIIVAVSMMQYPVSTTNNNNNGNIVPNPSVNNNPTGYQVKIQSFAFSPATVTIKSGDTVVWTNMDSAAHTVVSDSGSEISSSSLATGGTYSHTFSTPGTYTYHCSIHPSMKATIIVQ